MFWAQCGCKKKSLTRRSSKLLVHCFLPFNFYSYTIVCMVTEFSNAKCYHTQTHHIKISGSHHNCLGVLYQPNLDNKSPDKVGYTCWARSDQQESAQSFKDPYKKGVRWCKIKNWAWRSIGWMFIYAFHPIMNFKLGCPKIISHFQFKSKFKT